MRKSKVTPRILGGVTLLRKWAFPFYQKGITMPTVRGKKMYPRATGGSKPAAAAKRKPKAKMSKGKR